VDELAAGIAALIAARILRVASLLYEAIYSGCLTTKR
jgi:hypothetical protein